MRWVSDVCYRDGRNADSLVHRATMHVKKLCAHSPLLSISFKPFLWPCALVPLFFCLHYLEYDSSHRERFTQN